MKQAGAEITQPLVPNVARIHRTEAYEEFACMIGPNVRVKRRLKADKYDVALRFGITSKPSGFHSLRLCRPTPQYHWPNRGEYGCWPRTEPFLMRFGLRWPVRSANTRVDPLAATWWRTIVKRKRGPLGRTKPFRNKATDDALAAGEETCFELAPMPQRPFRRYPS